MAAANVQASSSTQEHLLQVHLNFQQSIRRHRPVACATVTAGEGRERYLQKVGRGMTEK